MLRFAADWRRWRALPASDRRLVLALLALLPATAAAIRLLGVGRVCGFLSRHPPIETDAQPADTQQARALARLVDAAARRVPGRPSCLPRSITLWWLLRRRGIDSALRIGVRTVDGRLHAHAWVELDGLVLNDDQDVGLRFAPFEGVNLPASRTTP